MALQCVLPQCALLSQSAPEGRQTSHPSHPTGVLCFAKAQAAGNDFVIACEWSRARLFLPARPALPADAHAHADAHADADADALARFARGVCDRRRGVGADGLVLLERPLDSGAGDADVLMRVLNSDGSVAEMCGNGLRAVCAVLAHTRWVSACCGCSCRTAAGESHVHPACEALCAVSQAFCASGRVRIQTVDSRVYLCLRGGASHHSVPSAAPSGLSFSVHLGAPPVTEFDASVLLQDVARASPAAAGSLPSECFAVDAGVPHVVFFVQTHDFDWCAVGRAVDRHPRFGPTRGTNVNFVVVLPADGEPDGADCGHLAETSDALLRSHHPDPLRAVVAGSPPPPTHLAVRTWERGAGRTLACGTGACSAAAAAVHSGRVPGGTREVLVETEGGTLAIALGSAPEEGGLWLTGPAACVFVGKFFSACLPE